MFEAVGGCWETSRGGFWISTFGFGFSSDTLDSDFFSDSDSSFQVKVKITLSKSKILDDPISNQTMINKKCQFLDVFWEKNGRFNPKWPFLSQKSSENGKIDLFLLNLFRLLFFFLPNIILVRCCLFQSSYSLFKRFRVAFFSSKYVFSRNWVILSRKCSRKWPLSDENSKNDSSMGNFPIFVQKSEFLAKMIESKLITIPHPVHLVQIWSILTVTGTLSLWSVTVEFSHLKKNSDEVWNEIFMREILWFTIK